MGNERVKLNVSLPAELRKAAKVVAAENGETLEALVERAVRGIVGTGAKVTGACLGQEVSPSPPEW